MSPAIRAAVVLFSAGLILSGCARAQARVEIPPPPLDVPPAPPRVVQTTDGEVPQPVGLAGDPADGAPALPAAPRARQTPTTPAPRPPAADAAKPEAPPATDAAKPPDEPRPQLRGAPTQQEEASMASLRARLTRASNQLQLIDYGRLSTDARDQYDRAKSFIREADDALRARNLPYATSLTDKAVALAAQLGGR